MAIQPFASNWIHNSDRSLTRLALWRKSCPSPQGNRESRAPKARPNPAGSRFSRGGLFTMNRIGFSFLIVTLMVGSAAAQSGTSSQTETTTKAQAKSGGGSTGVQAQSNTSVSGAQKTPTEQDKDKKGAKTSGKVSSSNSASGQAGQNSISLSSGATVQATLSKPVDAKKNKEGDAVSARVTQDVKSEGKVIIPKGSHLIGHVTQAKARAKGESESSLGIVFDRALLKGGQESALHLVIQAMTSAQTVSSASLGEG